MCKCVDKNKGGNRLKTFKHNAIKVKNPNTGNFEELPSFGGSSSVSIDKTLSEEGKAADAKEVGERLTAIENSISTSVNEVATLIGGDA